MRDRLHGRSIERPCSRVASGCSAPGRVRPPRPGRLTGEVIFGSRGHRHGGKPDDSAKQPNAWLSLTPSRRATIGVRRDVGSGLSPEVERETMPAPIAPVGRRRRRMRCGSRRYLGRGFPRRRSSVLWRSRVGMVGEGLSVAGGRRRRGQLVMAACTASVAECAAGLQESLQPATMRLTFRRYLADQVQDARRRRSPRYAPPPLRRRAGVDAA